MPKQPILTNYIIIIIKGFIAKAKVMLKLSGIRALLLLSVFALFLMPQIAFSVSYNPDCENPSSGAPRCSTIMSYETCKKLGSCFHSSPASPANGGTFCQLIKGGSDRPAGCTGLCSSNDICSDNQCCHTDEYCGTSSDYVDCKSIPNGMTCEDALCHTKEVIVPIDNPPDPAPTFAVLPIIAYPSSTLTGTATGTADPDGDAVTYYYEWSIDGVILRAGDGFNTFACPSYTACASGKKVDLNVTAWSIGTSGVAKYSPSRNNFIVISPPIVSNRAPNTPVIKSITSNPSPTSPVSKIIAVINATDPDGDPLIIEIEFRNSFGNTMALTSCPSAPSPHICTSDVLSCTISSCLENRNISVWARSKDATEYSPWASQNILIGPETATAPSGDPAALIPLAIAVVLSGYAIAYMAAMFFNL